MMMFLEPGRILVRHQRPGKKSLDLVHGAEHKPVRHVKQIAGNCTWMTRVIAACHEARMTRTRADIRCLIQTREPVGLQYAIGPHLQDIGRLYPFECGARGDKLPIEIVRRRRAAYREWRKRSG